MVAAAAGWQKASKRTGSRNVNDARLAKDIVGSIRAQAGAGVIKSAADYSSRVEVIEAVEMLLSK